ncbi:MULTISPECIES: LamG domain-containing protein [Streptomyces]|uniref:LamG domain-containing protein n=1 Tax=Streptomyces TaxID=1883 RepID=UPI00205F68D5|nr:MULTISPECIES: LamG domain-containing protein [Streptomyces]UPT41766.1 LamG domain-containing protein [Streptomyces sp. WAC00303]WIY75998.1 LamG domain-containing protein [Streptomyces anulatus]
MPVLVEAGWGGLVQYPWSITWTDITSRVDMVQGITVTRGASDEKSETQPGTCTMTLDNQDGALTPGRPGSPFFPFVRRNTPIRYSQLVMPSPSGAAPWPVDQLGDLFDGGAIDASLWPGGYGAPSVAGGRARIPCVSGAPAGMQSARSWTLAGSQITVKAVTVPAASTSSQATMSLRINSTTAGTRLTWTYNAVTGLLQARSDVGSADGAAVSLTYSAIDHAWWRIRETAGLVIWETSGDGWDWTVQRTLATPAWVTSQQQLVELAGTRVGGGTADYCEFDYLGAVVRPRFWGVVNEWPVSWSGLASSVSISATDLFKWLNKQPAMRSMLGMEVLTRDTLSGIYSWLAAYYPLTEATGSTAAGDIAGYSTPGALAVTQTGAGGTLEFGTDGVAETGETAVTMAPAAASAGRYLVGDLGPQVAADSTSWLEHIQVWIKTSTPGRAILGVHDPVLDHQLVLALDGSGVLVVESAQEGPPLTISTSASANLADGQWHHLVYDGSTKRVYVDGAAVGGTLTAVSTADIRTMYVGGYRGARLWAGQIAHVSLHLATGPLGPLYSQTYDAASGFAGESADWRVERLARYAGLSSVTVLGSTHDPMASQGPGGSSVVSRLREVESTESGKLYAERDYYGIAYQSRDLRYNPSPADETFTISYADLETSQVELSDDDQKLVNEVEASRPNGATQRVQAAESILAFGVYPESMTLLKTTDLSVLDAAMWRVMRYANPQPELREVPVEAATMPQYLDILDADISSYFTVYDLPEQAPADELRVTVEGYTETIKEGSHLIQFRTSESSTDSVWVIGDPVYGILGVTSRLAY